VEHQYSILWKGWEVAKRQRSDHSRKIMRGERE